MPRKLTMHDVRQDPVIRHHVIGLFLCGAALILDVAMSFSPMFWYYRYDVISKVDNMSLADPHKLYERHLDFEQRIFSAPGPETESESESDEHTIRLITSVGLWHACSKFQFKGRMIYDQCWDHDDEEFKFLPGNRLASGDQIQVAIHGYRLAPGHQNQFAKSTGVTQLFQSLGLLFLTVAVTTTCLKLFFLCENKFLIPLGVAHALWGAVSFIGSACVFGVGLRNASSPSVDLRESLHFSFAFAVISGVVALAGAVVLLYAVLSDKAIQENITQMQLESLENETVTS